MSLVGRVRARLGGGDGGRGARERVAEGVRERARRVDGESARQAAGRATQRAAVVDVGGQVPARAAMGGTVPADRRRKTREQEVAERAVEVASMAPPVESSLDPAAPDGLDELASTPRAETPPDPEPGGAPRIDGLATGIGSPEPASDADGGAETDAEPLFDVRDGDDGWGWL